MKYLNAILLMLLWATPALPAQEEIVTPSWSPKAMAEVGPELSKGVASTAKKVFVAKFKKAKSVETKLALIADLRKTGISAVFLKDLCKIAEREKDFRVRRGAVELLGAIGSKKAVKCLIRVLKAKKNHDEMELLSAAGEALGKCVVGSCFKSVENDFEKGHVDAKRGFILAWGFSKDWKAIKLLGEWIEPPSPANASSPGNPPADYWRRRHSEWRQVKRQVEWALWSITGKVFLTKKEVLEFYKKNPKPPKKKPKKKKRP